MAKRTPINKNGYGIEGRHLCYSPVIPPHLLSCPGHCSELGDEDDFAINTSVSTLALAKNMSCVRAASCGWEGEVNALHVENACCARHAHIYPSLINPLISKQQLLSHCLIGMSAALTIVQT